MSMDLADPVSSGKYCGTCVSTAPAVEPAVMSFTVSLTRSTIDAIAVSGPRALCRQTALFLDSNVQRGCLRRLVV